MIVKDLIHWGIWQMIGLDSARLDAELLLAHVLKKDRAYILAHDDEDVGFFKEWKYRKLVDRRVDRVPLAYLIGHKEFFGLDFVVDKHVLIPRPDTEILVENVISYIKPGNTLLDVGTGSGCIPISVVKNVPGVEAVACDISLVALKIAQDNVNAHGLGNRVKLIHSNLLESVPVELFDGTDLILTANLPYVPKGYEINEEAEYEPKLALYSGSDGLDLYRKMVFQLDKLRPKALFLECYEFQVAMLERHMVGYKLVHSLNMLGPARMMMLERVD